LDDGAAGLVFVVELNAGLGGDDSRRDELAASGITIEGCSRSHIGIGLRRLVELLIKSGHGKGKSDFFFSRAEDSGESGAVASVIWQGAFVQGAERVGVCRSVLVEVDRALGLVVLLAVVLLNLEASVAVGGLQ
jgi:hypothetical protein